MFKGEGGQPSLCAAGVLGQHRAAACKGRVRQALKSARFVVVPLKTPCTKTGIPSTLTLAGQQMFRYIKGVSSMKAVIPFLAAGFLVVSVLAADPVGFAMWKQEELKQRDQALSRKVGADHSARETLADYGDHRFRLLYRDADGLAEQHDNIVDVVIVQSGEGTLVLGGKMINLKAGPGIGEYVGTGIEGGERHPLAQGDLVNIPARTPHNFLVAKGKHITYVLVKLPAP
jgi:hypothetical protein